MDQIKTGKRSLLAPIALLIAAALTASIGLMGLAPDTAYAASKTKVWVVTNAKVIVPKSMQSDSSWSSSYTYSYNKSGLITSIKDSAKSYYAGTDKYVYNKKNRLESGSFKNNAGSMSWSEKYILNKKGCVKKIKGSKISYKYNSKNQVVKYTSGYDKSTETYLYDAQDRLSQIKSPQGWITETVFIYDASNQLEEIQTVANGTTDVVKLTNTYKNGRLVKQVVRTGGGKKLQTISYTYKKISVPKSLANRVKSQQNWVFFHYAAYGAGTSCPSFYNINTNFGVTTTKKAAQPATETTNTTEPALKAASA